MNDSRQLRNRNDDDRGAIDRAGQDYAGGPDYFVGVTTHVGTYPTAAGKVFLVIPQSTDFAETEGATVSMANLAGRVVPVGNLGTAIPTEGVSKVHCFKHRRKYVMIFNG